MSKNAQAVVAGKKNGVMTTKTLTYCALLHIGTAADDQLGIFSENRFLHVEHSFASIDSCFISYQIIPHSSIFVAFFQKVEYNTDRISNCRFSHCIALVSPLGRGTPQGWRGPGICLQILFASVMQRKNAVSFADDAPKRGAKALSVGIVDCAPKGSQYSAIHYNLHHSEVTLC